MELEIIGAGFGRTGTHSLKIALEILGFGPCYHMYEIIRNVGHVEKWGKIGMNGSVIDWTILLGNYRAAVDWPACIYWKDLAQQYNNAKVVLTVRDPEQWYEDARSTVFKAIEIGKNLKDREKRSRCKISGELIFERTFSGRHNDKDFVITRYNEHLKKVRKTLPAHRLLEFDVSAGWSPLCDFLNVQIPEEDFPESNSKEDFLRALLAGEI